MQTFESAPSGTAPIPHAPEKTERVAGRIYELAASIGATVTSMYDLILAVIDTEEIESGATEEVPLVSRAIATSMMEAKKLAGDYKQCPSNILISEDSSDGEFELLLKQCLSGDNLSRDQWKDLIGHTYRIGCVDPVRIIDFLDKNDLEGIWLGSVEMLDTLQQAVMTSIDETDSKQLADRYLNAVEALTFYYPALEMMGPHFRSLASELAGVAYEVIYTTIVPDYIPEDVRDELATEIELVNDEMVESIRKGVYGIWQRDVIKENLDGGNFTADSIKARVKQFGSALWKVERKARPRGNNPEASDVNDVIGVTVIVDDQSLSGTGCANGGEMSSCKEGTAQGIITSVEDIASIYSSFGELLEQATGLKIKDELAKEDDKHIEICYGGRQKRDFSHNLEGGRSIEVEINGKKPTGYQTIYMHYNIVSDDGVVLPVEIQIMEYDDWENATVGSASHLGYKRATKIEPEDILEIRNRAANLVEWIKGKHGYRSKLIHEGTDFAG